MKIKNRNRVVIVTALVFAVILIIAFLTSPSAQSFISGIKEGFDQTSHSK